MATKRILAICLLLVALCVAAGTNISAAEAEESDAVTVITSKAAASEEKPAEESPNVGWRRFLIGAKQPVRQAVAEPPAVTIPVEAAPPQLPPVNKAPAPAPKKSTAVAALPAQLDRKSIKADKTAADSAPDAVSQSHKENGELLLPPAITAPEPGCVARSVTFADEAAIGEISGVLPAPESEAPPEGFVDPEAEFTATDPAAPLDEQLTAAGVGTAVISPWRSVAASFFVLGLVFLLYGVVRLVKPKPLFKVDSDFELLREFTVSAGRKIALARVLNRVYLLGLAKDGVTLIDRVEDFADGGTVNPLAASVHHRERAAASVRSEARTNGEGGRIVAERPPQSVAEKTLGSGATYSPFRNRVNENGGSKRHAASADNGGERPNWFPRKTARPNPRGRLYLSKDGNGARKDYLLSKLKGEIERLT
jgi:flagellar biogenesis protein FliO